jgi:hypothetical protein
MNLIQLFVTRFFHNAVFSKTIKELPVVALFGQEKEELKKNAFHFNLG